MAGEAGVFACAGGSTSVSLLQHQRHLPSSFSDAFFLSGASPPFLGTLSVPLRVCVCVITNTPDLSTVSCLSYSTVPCG